MSNKRGGMGLFMIGFVMRTSASDCVRGFGSGNSAPLAAAKLAKLALTFGHSTTSHICMTRLVLVREFRHPSWPERPISSMGRERVRRPFSALALAEEAQQRFSSPSIQPSSPRLV
ncbi:hypothetical protein OH77DRAFT_788369 [Trametes cingulata]|nr:hypothetical protein OH77DRAFT_788369 [Trametes cingulata]